MSLPRTATVLTLGVALGLALVGTAAPARADEPWILGMRVGAVVPLTAPQSDVFSPGIGADISVLRPLGPALLVGVRAEGIVLGDGGEAPTGVQDPGVGGLFAAGAVVRLRAPSSGPARGPGPWIETGVAAGLTGGRVRPVVHAGAGWSFAVGPVALGPTVRYEQTLAFEGIDSRDARLAWAGLEVLLGDARAQAPAPARNRVPVRSNVARDSDGDGILDASDRCRQEPEDLDGFTDEDGCPDLDADADGILDAADACPNEAEVVNEIDDRDGCPDQGLVTLEGDRVVLDERVLFDLARARVRHAARPILHAIGRMIAQHPEWSSVSVEGHADVRGRAELNQVLSERRARAVVNVLSDLGVPTSMLSSTGWGATRPRAPGRDEVSYQRNRRVEFVVTGPGIRPRGSR